MTMSTTTGDEAAEPDQTSDETPDSVEAPPAPLLTLRDGLPDVVDTDEGLARACEALGAAAGPVAIDAERASGYRYSARAYLIQLRREGAGTWLIDPIAFEDLAPLQEALAGTEWILHAATQDLLCLREVGLRAGVALRHRARRPPAGLSARRTGHPGRDAAGPAHAQGALGGRLVDPPAAEGRGSTTPPSTSRCCSSCAS